MTIAPEKRTGFLGRLLTWHHLLPVASVVLLVVLGFALYTVYVDTRAMRSQLNRDFNRLQLVLARQVADQLTDDLLEFYIEMDRLSHRLSQDGSRDAMQSSMHISQSFLEYKGVCGIDLLDRQGRPVTSVREGAHAPPVDSAAMAAAFSRLNDSLTQKMLSDTWVVTREDSSLAIRAFMGCGLSTRTSGECILLIHLDLSRLISRVTQPIRSGQTGYAWVIDADGRYLYHPDAARVGRDAFGPRSEDDTAATSSAVNRIMAEHMLTGEEGSGVYESGWHHGVSGPVTKLIAYAPVSAPVFSPEQLWAVAVTAPISEVAKPVAEIRTRHFWIEIAMIACILGFGLLVFFYQRQMSRSLTEQVSEQEEYIAAIMQNSVDGIVFIDNNNRVKMWNVGAELIFGYTAEEMIGHSFEKLIPPELEPDAELGCIKAWVYTHGHVRNRQTQRLTKSGRRITVNISRTLIRAKDGTPLGSTAIIKDISDKVEMDKRIYNTEKLASIGILAAGVAHEINNPLAIILGFTDLLKERCSPDDPEFEELKMIEENANNARKIIQSLLGFARVSEGQGDAIDMNVALDTVVDIVRNTLLTNKVQMATDIDTDLPEARGDAREFQQVVVNLINNAVAAIGEDGGTLTLRARADRRWVTVEVADTGHGIPDRIKAQIFDPFFTTKTVGQGTGLGLSLCYGIVSKYGGRLEFVSHAAEDDPDQPTGTTFSVHMPRYDNLAAVSKGDQA